MKREVKNRHNNRKFNRERGLGIRGQLVLWLTLFVLMILIIVWIFQVLLLDFFYEQTKLSELESVQKAIDGGIDGENLDETCGELASQYDVCIAIYSVEDSCVKDVLITKEVSPTCIIHYADKEFLNSYYSKALEAGGVYTQRFLLSDHENQTNKPGDKPRPDRKDNAEDEHIKNKDMFVVAISVKAFEDSLGNEYAAFINLRFSPVNSIQHTRSVQFGYIVGVVVIASIVFALLFSNKIARPLERMTTAAEQMAEGNYSTEFKVEGYRETRRLADTLNYAVNEISKTDKLQRELIANTSHDLRTPLTLITGYAEMMRDIPGENTAENSQIIIDESRRLTTLVNDMLDYSKYSAGFEEPNIQRFNLTESIKKVIDRYSELVKLKGYRITFDYCCDIFVNADEKMIIQVMYNLINNALNYTGQDKTVLISQAVSNDGYVKISVKDSGEGISKEEIGRIWNRYYKVKKPHVRAITGSGLGLSIVSKLLQLHSATYGVESLVGHGSSFWFKLKVSE